jgi:hypothetical protein
MGLSVSKLLSGLFGKKEMREFHYQSCRARSGADAVMSRYFDGGLLVECEYADGLLKCVG